MKELQILDDKKLQNVVSSVKFYWEDHTLGKQYALNANIEIGSKEFFRHIKPWMNPYKFPWIMERIVREANLLREGHLLEVGCGMGFDSLEFLKRGVRVTATDLTSSAVELTRWHFEAEGVKAENILVQNVLELSFDAETFDAVWANGVLHHTGNTYLALREIHRVLKPNGRAIISHFYRRPSWMYWISRIGKENIEFKENDPPVTQFYTEQQILDMFDGFVIEEAVAEHYRALPSARKGLKAFLYHRIFKPIYNNIPENIAKKYAYKFSVTAIKA